MSFYCPVHGGYEIFDGCPICSQNIAANIPVTATNTAWPYEKKLHEKIKELEEKQKILVDALKNIQSVVNEQAEDGGLWCVEIEINGEWHPISIGEAYLQQELRKLHAVIENNLKEVGIE